MFDTYQEIFVERATSYQEAMDRWPRARDNEFLSVIEPLGPLGDRILCDMPAGGGYLHRYLPPETRYIAVEPTPAFVLNCPRGARLEVVESSIERVPLADASVDALVSLAGLHHCPDLAQVFAEMRRLLRAGGTAVIADVQTGSAPARFLNGYVDAHNPLGHRGMFLDAATPALLAAAGLRVIADEEVPVPWGFAHAADAGAYCAALFGIRGVSAEEVAAAMVEELGRCDGAAPLTIGWSLRRLVCAAG